MSMLVREGAAAFRRPISPTEWLYLAGARLAPPFAVQLFVEGAGTIGLGALQHAVDAAGDTCPGARLVRSGREWVATGAVPVRLVGAHPGLGLPGGLDPGTGPTCEVVLHEQAGRTVVGFRAFHGVMDGRGVLTWAAEVFRALRGEPAERVYDATITDHGLAARLGSPGRRPLLVPDRPSVLEHRTASRDPGAFLFRRRPLDGTYPALVARLAAALAAGGGTRFMIPVDLRRHDPALASTANLTLPIFLDGRAGGEGWEVWQERMLRALAARREVTGGLGERLAGHMSPATLAYGLGAVARRRGHLCSAIISHLGRVDPADFAAPGFAAETVHSLPVHAPMAPVSLVAVELPGRTELALSCQNGPGMADRADALLDRLAAALAGGPATEYAATPAPGPETTVVRMFRSRVAAGPGAVALTGPAGPVTYADLDRRSDVVAAELRSRGAGPGAVVGLLADRTPEALAGLWGVLKAGAAYLPLDPRHPDARLDLILTDARAALCLVQRPHAGRLTPAGTPSGPPAGTPPETPAGMPARSSTDALAGVPEGGRRWTVAEIVLDDLPTAGAEPGPDIAAPGDLAYVIYTSGSTGRPKGVQVEHRSLATYVRWATELYGVTAETRFALFTSLAFDLTGTAIFLPLLAGGSIALVPGEPGRPSLRAALQDANALKLTPAHLDLIGRLGLTADGFRVLIVGGEQLRTTVAAEALQRFGPGCRLINEYGPTEATIGCVVHVHDPDTATGPPASARARAEPKAATRARARTYTGVEGAVPIGRPVPGTGVRLLDVAGRPVPRGEIGELYLTGAQLARGYLGRPELDRERFVRLADGTRAYRTGDLARAMEDGELACLGRADDQIKIRGHRIEPGEVAAVLEEHPAVARAFVILRGAALCAYAVASGEVGDLREFAAARLPAPMVPTAVVTLPELPYTVNGKVDAAALPDPFGTPEANPGWPRAERADAVEAAVAGVWARVLRIDAGRIGADSDFHRLGGDSLTLLEMLALTAAEVVGAGREEEFMAALRDVIRNPTLGGVTAAARRTGAEAP